MSRSTTSRAPQSFVDCLRMARDPLFWRASCGEPAGVAASRCTLLSRVAHVRLGAGEGWRNRKGAPLLARLRDGTVTAGWEWRGYGTVASDPRAGSCSP